MSDQVAGSVASEPATAASGVSEGGSSDPFGIHEQADAPATEAPENVEQEIEEPQTQPEAEELPEKYRGKTPLEIAKMHLEAERAMHQKAQETADIKRQYEAIQALVQQLPQFQQQQPQQQQAPQQNRYFHEYSPEEQQQAAQYFAQEYGNDPLDAIYKLAVNQPYNIDQHLQNSPVLQQMMEQKMQQFFNGAFQQRQSTEQQFSNHVKQFSEAHPDFKTYQQDVAQFLQFSQSNGLINNLIQQKIDPLDFAYHYIKGYKAQELQAQAAQQTKQTMEAQQKERQAGFQLGQKTAPKPNAVYDPFGIYD